MVWVVLQMANNHRRLKLKAERTNTNYQTPGTKTEGQLSIKKKTRKKTRKLSLILQIVNSPRAPSRQCADNISPGAGTALKVTSM